MSGDFRIFLTVAACVFVVLTIASAVIAWRLQRRGRSVPLYITVVCIASIILGVVVINGLTNFLTLGRTIHR